MINLSSPTSSATVLYCLPSAGSSATMYARWNRLTAVGIQVKPIELPGRGARITEDFLSTFDDMVDFACQQINPAQQRFALFGHSMGALIAWAVAQRRQKAGLSTPLALFASASTAPSKRSLERFENLQTDDQLLDDLRRQGGTPEILLEDEEMRRITLDTIAADYRVCANFAYQQPARLDCPIHILAGKDDEISGDELNAWQLESLQQGSLRWFEGGHFYLRSQQDALVNHLEQLLTQVVSSRSYA